ncbi:MAG: NAD(P)-dependent oxidoreductase [Gammaproteobacteria bacterium]|nr:NAD(P)-dependent oxidoreductase [Gammaproteobacteria bacterium]
MKTGFIGLGAMGIPMAYHLHKRGYLVAVWNRTASKAATFAEETANLHASELSELCDMCQVIILCVSRDEDVRNLINDMLPHLQPQTIVIDTSTTNPDTAQDIGFQLNQHNVDFLDAPVTGGVEGAKKGVLAMMVGGDAAVLQRATPVLQSFTSRIEHMGTHGKGQAAKAVNQLMAAGINQAVTQALAFAELLQLPLDKTIEIVSSGAAGNWFLDHRGLTMTQGSFAPGFRVALHHKDLKICQQIARTLGVELSIADATGDEYQQLMDMGYGDEDISALYRLKKREFGLD